MALFVLGRAHYEGIDGVLDKSPSDAFRFLEQAATLGSSWAHELLGEMYMAGHGVDRDGLRLWSLSQVILETWCDILWWVGWTG